MNGEVRVVGFHSPLHLVSCNRATEGVRRVAESDVEGNVVALEIAVEIADLVMTSGYFDVRESLAPSCLKTYVAFTTSPSRGSLVSMVQVPVTSAANAGIALRTIKRVAQRAILTFVVLWRIPCEESLTIAMRGYCTEGRG